MRDNSRFNLTRLLICEGAKDKSFFANFIEKRNLPRFHVRTTNDKNDSGGGITKFEMALRATRLNRSFNNIAHIILVADNDEAPDTNFNNIRDQATRAGFQVPESELERSSGRPTIAIMMLPLNKVHGNLECVFVEAARNADRTISSYVDQFAALVGADQWTNSRRGKAWLRSILAVRCACDPFIPLGSALNDDRDNIIPLTDNSLDKIADFLGSYGSL